MRRPLAIPVPRRRTPCPAHIVARATALLVGLLLAVPFVTPPAVWAQEPELPPLGQYRSRLDVEPRVQQLTISQRCTALFGLMADWVQGWDPGAAREYRQGSGAFRAAAVRSRIQDGAGDAEAATTAAVAQVAGLYRARLGGSAATAPRLEADALISGDVAVCRDMLELIG